MAKDKTLRYRAQLERSIAELYLHMNNNLLGWLSETEIVCADDFTPEQHAAIDAVLAIEEEWIIDPDLREEISLITWTD